MDPELIQIKLFMWKWQHIFTIEAQVMAEGVFNILNAICLVLGNFFEKRKDIVIFKKR